MRTGGLLPQIRSLAVGESASYALEKIFSVKSSVWRIGRETASSKEFAITDDTDSKTVTVKRIK